MILVQVLINGLVNGSILALIALGLTLVFSISGLPNFSHGTIYTWGAFLTYFLVTLYGFDFFSSILLSAGAMALIGILIEKVAFRPLRTASVEAMFISSTGVLIAMENSALLLWGERPRTIPAPMADSVISVPGWFSLPTLRLLMVLLAAVTILLLEMFVMKTRTGKAIRAAAEDAISARLMGIRIDRVVSLSFGVGCALAAVAGSLVGAAFSLSFDMGTTAVLKAFVVVVLGGMGSIAGAIAGGLAIGVIESFTLTYVTSEFKSVATFGILIAILVLRPSGIFGQKGR